MKSLMTVLIAALLLVAWTAGCEDKNKTTEPLAQAPAQEPAPDFPENQVPPPEPQPVAQSPASMPPRDAVQAGQAEAGPAATPVEEPAPRTAARPKAKPKESYAPAAKASRTHVVAKGDTLQKISKKFYGTTKNWKKIYEANRRTLKGGPDSLVVGTKLIIP